MAHRRTARVADLVKQEVSQIIQHEMKDPRIGFVTVTSVEVSVDLRHARVYFSVLGSQEDQKASLEALERAKGYIRTQLGRKIKLRHIPELFFRYDESFDYAQRISNVMRNLETTDNDSGSQTDQVKADHVPADRVPADRRGRRRLMTVLRSVQEAATCFPRSVIAVGNFDGVHRGHGAIIERAIKRSAAVSAPCMVVTFDPHPQLVVGRKPSLPILTPTDQKLELLSQFEIDAVLVIPFTDEFAGIEAESFVKATYVDTLDIREIVLGYSHNFGRHGRGDRLLLEKLSARYGFAVHVVQPIRLEGSPVNSSHIRAILSAGETAAAERLLGHPYAITGTVVRGDGRGSALRFPTANLEAHDPDVLIPKRGVYAVRVRARRQGAKRA